VTVGGDCGVARPSEPCESFKFTPNSLSVFYPRQLQKLLQRNKKLTNQNQTSERLTQNMKPPQALYKSQKHLQKVKDLTICQANFMQVLLQKIDNRSRPIRKHERIISHNLKKKRILLDQENFDIISILK